MSVDALRSILKLPRSIPLSPVSNWFSYGSNLDEAYFNDKMTDQRSPLTLGQTSNGVLSNHERRLDNESSRHGLAYEIHPEPGAIVEGILHQVPFPELEAFLKMEGLLRRDGSPSGLPRYRAVPVAVQSEGVTYQAISLEGLRRVAGLERERLARAQRSELEAYIKASLQGATTRDLGTTQFQTDLDWLLSLR